MPVSPHLSLARLSIPCGSCSHYGGCRALMGASVSPIPSPLSTRVLLKGRVITSLPFIYLFSLLKYEFGFMDIAFICWAIVKYYSYFFYCPSCSRFGWWELFQVSSCVLLT